MQAIIWMSRLRPLMIVGLKIIGAIGRILAGVAMISQMEEFEEEVTITGIRRVIAGEPN